MNHEAYTIYNSSTGVIRKVLSATEETIADYLNTGEAFLAGNYSPANWKIESGSPVFFEEALDVENSNRMVRDSLLQESDWTQVPDSPLSDSKKAEWITYRQALRNLPTHSNWPNLEDADWPTQPT